MTRKELERNHPDYDLWVDEWLFYVRSYMGGRAYREGGHLLRHPFESAANYERRKSIAYYYNYCAPIADIMVSHLFRRDASRDYGSLAADPLFASFLEDADMEGTSYRQFMREAARMASVYGRVSIVVDMPREGAATRLDAIEGDVRPYLALVTPEHMTDWSYSRAGGRPLLESVKIKEGDGLYRVWTRDSWELWGFDEEGGGTRLMDGAPHALGEVPVVTLYNKRSGARMIGVSDLQDIADINRNIYYLCSDAKEIIENTAFPMLAMPSERGGASADREVGPRNIVRFDAEAPGARPYWLEAPHSSLGEIREWVRQDIAEIHRIAKLGGVKSAEDYGAVRSGAALEIEHRQLYAALAEKADNIEHAENAVLKLWARWMDDEFDGRVDYPDDFSIRDLGAELDAAIKARTADVESATYKKEAQKLLARAALPKADEEVRARIEAEIEGGA